jgi:hypothetical protein
VTGTGFVRVPTVCVFYAFYALGVNVLFDYVLVSRRSGCALARVTAKGFVRVLAVLFDGV